MPLRIAAIAALLLGLSACSSLPQPTADYTPPWLVGQAGGPFPYNSPYCP